MNDTLTFIAGLLVGAGFSVVTMLGVFRTRLKLAEMNLKGVAAEIVLAKKRQYVQFKLLRDMARKLRVDQRADDRLVEFLIADLEKTEQAFDAAGRPSGEWEEPK